MLIVFGGLPGVGKSTLAQKLARHFSALYLRIDSVEQALRDVGQTEIGPQGYAVAYRLAADNLRLGNSVVADSVNPLHLTRQSWRDVATQAQVPLVEIEVVCSDEAEHRARVETRVAQISGLRLPSWSDVVNREYETWENEHIWVDTAHRAPDESFRDLLSAMESVG